MLSGPVRMSLTTPSGTRVKHRKLRGTGVRSSPEQPGCSAPSADCCQPTESSSNSHTNFTWAWEGFSGRDVCPHPKPGAPRSPPDRLPLGRQLQHSAPRHKRPRPTHAVPYPRGQHLELPHPAYPQPALEARDTAPTASCPAGTAIQTPTPGRTLDALLAGVIGGSRATRSLEQSHLTAADGSTNELHSRCLAAVWGGLESQAWGLCREEQGSESHRCAAPKALLWRWAQTL